MATNQNAPRRGPPENLRNPGHSGNSTIRSEAQGVHIVHSLLAGPETGCEGWRRFQPSPNGTVFSAAPLNGLELAVCGNGGISAGAGPGL